MAPPATYVVVILNVTIVTLARNDSARTSELFPFGAKFVLRTDSTLRRNFSAGVYVRTFVEDRTLRRSCPLARNYFPAGLWDWIYVEAVRYVEMVPLARNYPVGTSFRLGLEGWSNRRVDSNQTIDSTLQVDSTI